MITERLAHVICMILISHCLKVQALLCYQCNNVTSPFACNTLITCSQLENCFTEGYTDNTKTVYNLGCKITKDCFKPTQDNVIVGKRSTADTGNCHQCCGIDECNTHLCSDYPVIPDTSKVCSDDPSFDCIRTSGFYNLCADVKHARTVCKKFCGLCNILDGNWSEWTIWSSCDVTCGQGLRSRSRSCSNPAPTDGGMQCVGNRTEYKTCNMSIYCPINGQWNDWSPWSVCTVTCGPGLQRRERNCSSPHPKYGGDYCVGDAIEDRNCFQQGCVDGGWSLWSSWGTCSVTCGTGITSRQRSCDNPLPSQFGKPCKGDRTSSKLCHLQSCSVDGKWTDWSSWTSCSTTCGNGQQERTRTCSNPPPSLNGRLCFGSDKEKVLCKGPTTCSEIGHWSLWSSWTVVNCYNNGVCSCHRLRSCSSQNNGGKTCSGNDSETIYFMIYQEKCKH